MLDARPDVVSIPVGVGVGADDMGRHAIDPEGRVIPVEEFEAGHDRLLARRYGAVTGDLCRQSSLYQGNIFRCASSPSRQKVSKVPA